MLQRIESVPALDADVAALRKPKPSVAIQREAAVRAGRQALFLAEPRRLAGTPAPDGFVGEHHQQSACGVLAQRLQPAWARGKLRGNFFHRAAADADERAVEERERQPAVA